MNDSSDRQPRRSTLRKSIRSASSSASTAAGQHMPQTARELVQVLEDMDVVLRLLSLFGGCTFRIPTQWPQPGRPDVRESNPLRRILSSRRMQLLVGRYGGTELYIPRCLAAMQRLRNNAMVAWFNESTRRGMSTCLVVRRLARRYNLSDRRVWDILKYETLPPMGDSAQGDFAMPLACACSEAVEKANASLHE